jgi:hypothetical protein
MKVCLTTREGDVRQRVKNTVMCYQETVWTGKGERPLRNKKDKEETVFNLDKTQFQVDSYPVRHHVKDCKDQGNGDETPVEIRRYLIVVVLLPITKFSVVQSNRYNLKEVPVMCHDRERKIMNLTKKRKMLKERSFGRNIFENIFVPS